ncbi:MAG: C39 family peptidase [Patescibacteria group bacterium]|jgi:hypothetical protein
MAKKKFNIIYAVIGLPILFGLIWYGASLGIGVAPQTNDGTTPTNRTENTAGANTAQEQLDGLPNKILIANVPFTSQAPTGQWSDDRQQNDCEEAAVLIGTKWMIGESIGSTENALAQLLTLSKLAESMFGSYVDSSAADTLKLFQKYTDTTQGQVKYDVTMTDIKTELAAGHILLSPMNGQALNNPNFTGAGPERHFLVIIGYDDKTGMFTTQDPGTRKGQNYRYKYETLFAAMRDYPTGDHEKIVSNRRAVIIVNKV